MSFIFPHLIPKPEYVQPDYQAWAAVQIGMTRDEVVTLLGPPHHDRYHGGKPKRDDAYYSYGYIQLPYVHHPRTYSFTIGFDENGFVFYKGDPFGGRFSMDGSPVVPEIITPLDQSVFNHYPRVVDLRWYPSSGVYPVSYTCAIGHFCPLAELWSEHETIDDGLISTFHTTVFVGGQPGRIRLKATNAVGESDWSEYRYFRFLR
jgi:hypothetical protein